MFAVCPSCQRFLGRRTPLEQRDVVEEVCAACAARPTRPAVVVVSRLRKDTLAILQALLAAAPEFQVVLERRASERAPVRMTPAEWHVGGAESGPHSMTRRTS